MLCAIFAVKFRVDVQKRFGGLLGEPYDQLVAEARPGRGKALLCAGVLRTGAVGILKIFALNVPVIAGDPADHAGLVVAGEDGGVQRVGANRRPQRTLESPQRLRRCDVTAPLTAKTRFLPSASDCANARWSEM